MNTESLKKMREPFPANQINYLPKPTKKREEMEKIPKAICSICGGYHATKNIIHLSYVGHAALTDRLLEVDPCWTWEPLATDQNGLPAIDKDGGLWIRLTVCGVTRLGYGDAQGKTGGDAMKERIGDALRNAAMRFGAALELWHKGDLKPGENPEVVTDPQENHKDTQQQQPQKQPQSAGLTPSQQAYAKLQEWIDQASANKKKFPDQESFKSWFLDDNNTALITQKQLLDASDTSAINRHFEHTMALLPKRVNGQQQGQQNQQDLFGDRP